MNEIKNVMSRFRLLDIKFVMRKGLAFVIVLIPLVALFTGTMLFTNRAFPSLPFYAILILGIGLAILLSLWSLPLWVPIQEFVDRMFYRRTYAYRQILLRFSARMGNILALDQLSLEMLVVISKALHISQTRLLLKDGISGNYVTRYKYPTAVDDLDKEPHLPSNGPIAVWLQKESQPLNMRQIESILKSSDTGSGESGVLANLEFLFPLKRHGKLVAILAIGRKQSKMPYSHEDLKLLMVAVNQAGAILENALLYSELIRHTHELQTLNRKLMAVDKRRVELIITTSHELQTYLTANDSNLGSILSEKSGHITNDQRGQLEKIIDSENRITILIEDILNEFRVQERG